VVPVTEEKLREERKTVRLNQLDKTIEDTYGFPTVVLS